MAEATLDERFEDLRRFVDGEIARARSELLDGLSRALARMRAATNEPEWNAAVLESGRALAGDAAAIEFLGALAALTAPWSAALTPDSGARRFAKVKVAEIQLYQADAVKAGRAARDLYAALKPHIDTARDVYRDRFLMNGGGAADYLHQELVRSLANDDATLLGPGYPGPLV